LGDKQQHLNEIVGYLMASFGDYQRIDFGTGHEAHFAAWLYVPRFFPKKSNPMQALF